MGEFEVNESVNDPYNPEIDRTIDAVNDGMNPGGEEAEWVKREEAEWVKGRSGMGQTQNINMVYWILVTKLLSCYPL